MDDLLEPGNAWNLNSDLNIQCWKQQNQEESYEIKRVDNKEYFYTYSWQ